MDLKLIANYYSKSIPHALSKDILLSNSHIDSKLKLKTGKQVWDSWDHLSRTIENEVIPAFEKSKVLNADGSIPSGMNVDLILHRFRQYMFDEKFNKILIDSTPAKLSSE